MHHTDVQWLSFVSSFFLPSGTYYVVATALDVFQSRGMTQLLQVMAQSCIELSI
jgi:hypothetical protein